MSKYSDIWGLINALPGVTDREELKSDLCYSFSDGRTTSLRELREEEVTRLRVWLRAEVKRCTPKDRTRTRRRSIVLSLLEEYGVDVQDWTRVNAFCEDLRIAGKPFGRLTEEELTALATKLRIIIRKEKARAKDAPKPRPRPLRKYIRLGGCKREDNYIN